MSTALITGNIFSLLASICMGISVIKKSKKDLVWWQTLTIIFSLVTCILLLAYSALILTLCSLLRNILEYRNKLTVKWTFVLTLLGVIIGLYVNNRGIFGLLGIIATASYTACMYITKNEQQMRYALVSNLILWGIHDLYVQAYPSVITKIILTIWTIIQIVRCRKSFRTISA